MNPQSVALGNNVSPASGGQLVDENPSATRQTSRNLDEIGTEQNVDVVASHPGSDSELAHDRGNLNRVTVKSISEDAEGKFSQLRIKLRLKLLTFRLKLSILRLRFYFFLARLTHRLAMIFLRLQYGCLEAHYSRLKVNHFGYNLRIAGLFGKGADLFAELNRFIYFGDNHSRKSVPVGSVGQPAKGSSK